MTPRLVQCIELVDNMGVRHSCSIGECKSPATAFVFLNEQRAKVCTAHLPNLLRQGLHIYKIQAIDSGSLDSFEILSIDQDSAKSTTESGLDLQESASSDVNTYLNLGLFFEKTVRNYEEAEKALSKALELGLTYAPRGLLTIKTYVVLADFYMHTRRLDEAEANYQKALEIGTTYFPIHLELAKVMLRLGELYRVSDHRKAVDAFLRSRDLCLAHFPRSKELMRAYTGLAYTHIHQHAMDEAEHMCSLALELGLQYYRESEEMAQVWMCLGYTQAEMGQIDKAEESLGKGLRCAERSCPDALVTAELHLALGNVNYLKNMTASAEEEFKVVTGFPESILTAKAYFYMGNLYCDTLRLSESEQVYEAALRIMSELSPNISLVAQIKNNLGLLYRRMNQFRKAEHSFQESIRTQIDTNDVAETYLNLGLLYEEMGQYEEAKASLETALTSSSTDPLLEGAVYLALGKLHLNRGYCKEAEESFKSSLLLGEQHDLVLLARSYSSLGELYVHQLLYSQAEKAYLKSLDLIRKFPGYADDWWTSCFNLGLLYKHMGDLQNAEQVLIESQEVLVRTDLATQTIGCIALGRAFCQLKILERAESVLKHGLELVTLTTLKPIQEAQLWILLGDVEYEKQNWAKARESYSEVARLADMQRTNSKVAFQVHQLLDLVDRKMSQTTESELKPVIV